MEYQTFLLCDMDCWPRGSSFISQAAKVLPHIDWGYKSSAILFIVTVQFFPTITPTKKQPNRIHMELDQRITLILFLVSYINRPEWFNF